MDVTKCMYCSLCAKKCPQGALTVNRKELVWEVDKEKCIGCMVCALACPKKAIHMEKG